MCKKIRDSRKKRKEREQEKVYEGSEELLVKEIGNEFKKLKDEKTKEREALDFCKDYSKDREWCFNNHLDFRCLPEEATY